VGDGKYGDFELNRRVARGEFGVPLRRMFLHAWATRFRHPVAGTPMEIESALDRECSDFLQGIGHA
jgi:23S rRNA pseudouridine955/2504/2580 synthase